jgi:hypothetical protein
MQEWIERQDNHRDMYEIQDCQDDKTKKAGGWSQLSTFQRKEIAESCYTEYSNYKAQRYQDALKYLKREPETN